MIGACIAIATMAAVIIWLAWSREQTWRRAMQAERDHEAEYKSAQFGFKAREREIDELKKQIEQLQGREIQQAKLRSEHEDAFDQIFAIVQKHARPF